MDNEGIERNVSNEEKAVTKSYINEILKLHTPQEALLDVALFNEQYSTEILKPENKEIKEYMLNNVYSFLDTKDRYVSVVYIDEYIETKKFDYICPIFEVMYAYGISIMDNDEEDADNEVDLKEKNRVIFIMGEKNGFDIAIFGRQFIEIVAKVDIIFLTDDKYKNIRTKLKDELNEKHNLTLKIFQ